MLEREPDEPVADDTLRSHRGRQSRLAVADGTMSNIAIGAAHFSEEEYTDADGETRTDITAALQIALLDGSEPDQHLAAYPDLEFSAGGMRFRVEDVNEGHLVVEILGRNASSSQTRPCRSA